MPSYSEPFSINALGVFGTLEDDQENYFKHLQEKYSKFPEDDDTADTFRHLTLVFSNQVPLGKLPDYLDLLRELKTHLPFRLNVSDVILVSDKDVALAFDIKQTKQIRNTANKFFSESIVNTYYTNVVRFVPKQNQEEVINILKETKEMFFNDFVLCANSVDGAGTIYSSNSYK